jgi:hypothetical protein
MAVTRIEAFLISDQCDQCLLATVRVVQDPESPNCVLLTINNLEDEECDTSGEIGSFCLLLNDELNVTDVESLDKERTLQVSDNGCPGNCLNEANLVVRFSSDQERITQGGNGEFRICFDQEPVDTDFIAVSVHFQEIECCTGVDSLCVDSIFNTCAKTTISTTPTISTTSTTTTSTTTTSTTSTTSTTTTATHCPIPNPQSCCIAVVEFKTQLVPPALEGTIKITKIDVKAAIEDVCPEKVIICGKVIKEFTYTAVETDGTQRPGTKRTDERPFQCLIDREDANEGDEFVIVGADILCEGNAFVKNMGTRPNQNNPSKTVNVFWRLSEKDLVKVCIRKV